MKTSTLLRRVALTLSCLGLLTPETVVWAAEAPTAPAPADVSTDAQGVFHGKLVDPQGLAMAQEPVVLLQGSQQLAQAVTDAQGQFAFSGVQAGVYNLLAAKGIVTCRIWPADIAPPAAKPGLLIVSGNTVVRGADPYTWISEHYILFTLAVATAIAVPCAVIGSQQHHHPHSP